MRFKKILDEVTMLARNKSNDGYDNVNNDVVQGRSEVESEEKYQTKISKKMLQHQIPWTMGKNLKKTKRK